MAEPIKKQCKACGKDIVFLMGKNNRNIPVDANTAYGNNGTFDPTKGHYPHNASCNEIDKLREMHQEQRKRMEASLGNYK